MSLCCKTVTFLILNHHIILTFLLTKQTLSTYALLNLIEVDSWGKEWGQGRLSCSRWAEGDRWAARCVTNKTKITNATMRQSTVRWRRSMARGSRGRSTRVWWLFRVGCWVTAVVVGANRHGWCVSSVVVSRVFWSSARGERWIVDMRRLSLMRRRCHRQVKNLPGFFTEDRTFAKSTWNICQRRDKLLCSKKCSFGNRHRLQVEGGVQKVPKHRYLLTPLNRCKIITVCL